MLTCGELARFLEASAARVERELTPHTRHFLDGVATDARALIGQELPEWAPLAASTIAEKERLGFGGQVSATDPLLRKGGLRSSITASAQAAGRGAEGAVSSNSKVALYQEMGTSRIPPRPFLGNALGKAQPKAEREFGHFGVELLSPGVR